MTLSRCKLKQISSESVEKDYEGRLYLGKTGTLLRARELKGIRGECCLSQKVIGGKSVVQGTRKWCPEPGNQKSIKWKKGKISKIGKSRKKL